MFVAVVLKGCWCLALWRRVQSGKIGLLGTIMTIGYKCLKLKTLDSHGVVILICLFIHPFIFCCVCLCGMCAVWPDKWLQNQLKTLLLWVYFSPFFTEKSNTVPIWLILFTSDLIKIVLNTAREILFAAKKQCECWMTAEVCWRS